MEMTSTVPEKVSIRESERLKQIAPGALVKITRDLPFTPSGIYRCLANCDSVLLLNVGALVCGIGRMYAAYVEPVKDCSEDELLDEQTLRHYTERAVAKLHSPEYEPFLLQCISDEVKSGAID